MVAVSTPLSCYTESSGPAAILRLGSCANGLTTLQQFSRRWVDGTYFSSSLHTFGRTWKFWSSKKLAMS